MIEVVVGFCSRFTLNRCFNMKHEDARKRVCILCFRKTGPQECLESATQLVHDRINEHVVSNVNLSDSRVPTGLCSSCRTKLKNVETGGRKATFDLELLSNYLNEQKRLSPRRTTCECVVCQIGNANGIQAKAILKKYQQSSGRPSTSSSPPEPIRNLCGVCLSPTYQGSNHDRSRCGETKYKLDNAYDRMTEEERQQFAARVNRETAESSGSETFSLKTLRRPQTVTLGKPQQSFQMSHADVDHLQADAKLTPTQMITS